MATIDEGTSTVIAKVTRLGAFSLMVAPRDWDASADSSPGSADAATDAEASAN